MKRTLGTELQIALMLASALFAGGAIYSCWQMWFGGALKYSVLAFLASAAAVLMVAKLRLVRRGSRFEVALQDDVVLNGPIQRISVAGHEDDPAYLIIEFVDGTSVELDTDAMPHVRDYCARFLAQAEQVQFVKFRDLHWTFAPLDPVYFVAERAYALRFGR